MNNVCQMHINPVLCFFFKYTCHAASDTENEKYLCSRSCFSNHIVNLRRLHFPGKPTSSCSAPERSEMEAFIHTHLEIHFQNHIKFCGTILHYDENGRRICKIKYLTLIQYESKCTRTDPALECSTHRLAHCIFTALLDAWVERYREIHTATTTTTMRREMDGRDEEKKKDMGSWFKHFCIASCYGS